MATAYRTPVRARDRQLERLFRREIAPHVPSLQAERIQGRARFITTAIAFACGIPMVLYALWPLGPAIAGFAGIVTLALGLHLLGGEQRRFRDRVRALVMPAICQAIGDLRHSTGSAPDIPFDALESLGLLPRHNRCRVDDVFDGRHRDTDFIMAEVRLRYRSSGRRSRTRTVFRGLILAIGVPREIPARILIARDSGRLGNRLKGWIKSYSDLQRVAVPHPAFEACFEMYSDQPDAARDLLGPAFCDAMVALADAHEGETIQGAFRYPWFYLTLPKRGDQFRLGSLFRPLNELQAEVEQAWQDVQIVHRVIDTLHGVTR